MWIFLKHARLASSRNRSFAYRIRELNVVDKFVSPTDLLPVTWLARGFEVTFQQH